MELNKKLANVCFVTEEIGKIKTAWSLEKFTRRNAVKELSNKCGIVRECCPVNITCQPSLGIVTSGLYQFIDNDPFFIDSNNPDTLIL